MYRDALNDPYQETCVTAPDGQPPAQTPHDFVEPSPDASAALASLSDNDRDRTGVSFVPIGPNWEIFLLYRSNAGAEHGMDVFRQLLSKLPALKLASAIVVTPEGANDVTQVLGGEPPENQPCSGPREVGR